MSSPPRATQPMNQPIVRFIAGYAVGIWLGFLCFVVSQLPAHPDPWPFARMFLLLHPLWVTGLGAEFLFAIPRAQRSKLRKATTTKAITPLHILSAGVSTGLLATAVVAVLCSVAYFTTAWLLIAPLVVLLIAPAVGLYQLIRRLPAVAQA